MAAIDVLGVCPYTVGRTLHCGRGVCYPHRLQWFLAPGVSHEGLLQDMG